MFEKLQFLKKKKTNRLRRGEQSYTLLEKLLGLELSKRQRFVISVLILSVFFFFLENLRLSRIGILAAILLGILTDVLLIWSNYRDLRDNFTINVFILPFFYSVGFVTFYFLFPDRILTRISLTTLYVIGIYSLFLSQNIFIVASMKTIALLSSARTVSFIIAIVSFLCLTTTLFTTHLFVFPFAFLLFFYSFLLIIHTIWIYTLEKSFKSHALWATSLSLALVEVGVALWFWPAFPLTIGIFLSGFFYIINGLSHVWHERRLFRGVLWEYLLVGAFVFIPLIINILFF